jgi:uncharacterized iron-regulated membrane protein
MGIPVSILLIAVGAILAFAVNRSPNGLNVHAVGWILMIVGILGLVLTMLWWDSWWGRRAYRRGAYVEPGVAPRRAVGYPARRRTVVQDEVPPAAPAAYVEEEEVPPPGPPPP